MSCQRCQSERLVSISTKCSDLCFTDMPSEGVTLDGYAPRIPNVTGKSEDYVEFRACLECGQLQGKFPVASPHSRTVGKFRLVGV